MSGDVQPRKRKDKRRKKDASSSERSKAEAEFIARKFSVTDDSDEGPSIPAKPSAPHTSHSSHGSHAASQLGEGDAIIHVHHEGGTGGHWCAKIIFFLLLGVLVGLIGLILLENRGLTDLDTPVAESRYAQVFDGWVDEGPAHDDHHDEHTLELKHGDDDDDDHDDHDDHDEEDDEDIEDIEHEHHDDDEEDDEAVQSDEGDEQDDNLQEDHDEDDDDVDEDHNEDDDDDDDDTDKHNDDDDDDEDDDEGNEDNDDARDSQQDDDDSGENDNEQDAEDQYNEIDYDGEGDNDDDDGDDDDGGDNDDDDDYLNASYEKSNAENDDNDDIDDDNADSQENISNALNSDEEEKGRPFEEVDSIEEEVIDNHAGEEEHLALKRAEQLAHEQEEEESTGMGMRLAVGLALMTVAYCVLARKLRNDDEDTSDSGDFSRRMTLIDENVDDVTDEAKQEVEEKITSIKKPVSSLKSEPPQSMFSKPKPIIHRYEESDDEDVEIIQPVQAVKSLTQAGRPADEELEDDPDAGQEEEEEYDDEDVEEISREELKEAQIKQSEQAQAHDRVPDEHIGNEYDDEPFEEDLEEEGDDEELLDEEEEEDISEEIDDSALLKKLEAKYGKLTEKDDDAEGHSDDEKPVTPTRKRKQTGGDALGDSDSEEWANEPEDRWKEQLDLAQAEMDESRVEEAYRRFTALSLTNPLCPLAKVGRARALDSLAESKRSNGLLQSAIKAYKDILNMKIKSDLFRSIANRTINLIRFRGKHLEAVPVHRMLIDKFPQNPSYKNQLAITYLMVNKVELSRNVLLETLKIWPHDGVALVHYGFILKTVDNNLAEAVTYMQEGVDSGADGTLEGRFLFHLGDAYARLGQNDRALKIYDMGAQIGVFLSKDQRSLYNVDRLTGRPWWKPEETPYKNFIDALETNWKQIAREAKRLRTQFKPEQENLKDTGDWSQYELFVRGREIKEHCAKCPITCGIIHTEAAASGCRRGQAKFSAMAPLTHVFAHTGPTNCRLRAHLGLEGTDGTFIRVAQQTKSWEIGKVFIFDDSFEHEVWHNGSALRIVLIVDLWHPELTAKERASLPAI